MLAETAGVAGDVVAVEINLLLNGNTPVAQAASPVADSSMTSCRRGRLRYQIDGTHHAT